MTQSEADRSAETIGQALLKAGLVTQSQLDEALAIQDDTGRRLGNILIDLGYVDEEAFCRLLSEHLGIPFFDLVSYFIDPAVVQVVPEHLCERYRLIPLKKEGDRLTVAMVDPMNPLALEDLRILTGLVIKPVIATPSQIYHALSEAYEAIHFSKKLTDVFPDLDVRGRLFSLLADLNES